VLRRLRHPRHAARRLFWREPAQPVAIGLALVAAAVLVAGAALVPQFAAGRSGGAANHSRHALDEGFEGNSLDASVWNTCYWWECTIESNDELQWYESSQVKVDGGRLHLTAEAEPVTTAEGRRFPYRSGMISSGPAERDGEAKFSFTYGTVEARLRVPAGRGLWSALWMLPTAGGSRPEVDVVEVLGHDTRTSYQSLHRKDRDAKPFEHAERGTDLANGWHVYRLEWLPEKLRWYIDDELVFSVTGEEVPDEPMYVVANLAVGGRWPGRPDESTKFPSSLVIDYIEVRPRLR
jgi:beta-glucanase (GH16 family)